MPENEFHTRFESDLFRIQDFRCCGAHSGWAQEESSDVYDIAITRRGLFVRRDASGVVMADANQVLFFQRDQPYQVSHPVPGGDTVSLFGLNVAALMDIVRGCDPAVDDRPDRPFPVGSVPLDRQRQVTQNRLVQTAFACQQMEPLEVEERVLLLLAEVIRFACAAVETSRPAKPATAQARADLVNHVRLVLAARFQEKVRLNQLAAAVHSSPFFLCRVFKQETGVSIHQYIHRLRLLHALELLADQAQDLAALSLNLGFASHSHFSTAFRREFGLSPAEYRQSLTVRRVRELSKILKV